MLSADARGRPADDDAIGASVSRDGRWTAFQSDATNLDRRTRDGRQQVYLRDARTGKVRAVGTDGRGRLAVSAASVSLSPSGRFVAYCSTDELVGPDSSDVDDNTPNTDVFVRDLKKGTVRRASSAPGGGEADDYSCFPDVADTGDVGFFSRATEPGRRRHQRRARLLPLRLGLAQGPSPRDRRDRVGVHPDLGRRTRRRGGHHRGAGEP